MPTLYVKPDLSSDGAGTRADPYQVSQIVAAASDGDTIYFLRPSGELTWATRLAFTQLNLTVEADPTDFASAGAVVLDQAVEVSGSWADEGSGAYSIASAQPTGVWEDYGDDGNSNGRNKGVLRVVADTATVQSTEMSYFWDSGAGELWVHLLDDEDPAAHTIEAVYQASGGISFQPNDDSEHLTCRNLIFRRCADTSPRVFTANDVDHIVWSNCQAHDCTHASNAMTSIVAVAVQSVLLEDFHWGPSRSGVLFTEGLVTPPAGSMLRLTRPTWHASFNARADGTRQDAGPTANVKTISITTAKEMQIRVEDPTCYGHSGHPVIASDLQAGAATDWDVSAAPTERHHYPIQVYGLIRFFSCYSNWHDGVDFWDGTKAGSIMDCSLAQNGDNTVTTPSFDTGINTSSAWRGLRMMGSENTVGTTEAVINTSSGSSVHIIACDVYDATASPSVGVVQIGSTSDLVCAFGSQFSRAAAGEFLTGVSAFSEAQVQASTNVQACNLHNMSAPTDSTDFDSEAEWTAGIDARAMYENPDWTDPASQDFTPVAGGHSDVTRAYVPLIARTRGLLNGNPYSGQLGTNQKGGRSRARVGRGRAGV